VAQVSERVPSKVLELISGLDVVNNFCFLPHRRFIDDKPTPLLTLCNCYLTVCTAALGCPVPPMLANKQAAWLASNEGKLAGWMGCDAVTAHAKANLGYPVVAVAVSPTGHGHVALVVPSDPSDAEHLYVSAAGARNFVRTRIERSFGDLRPSFFTHL
jgi:hypothetical protein